MNDLLDEIILDALKSFFPISATTTNVREAIGVSKKYQSQLATRLDQMALDGFVKRQKDDPDSDFWFITAKGVKALDDSNNKKGDC